MTPKLQKLAGLLKAVNDAGFTAQDLHAYAILNEQISWVEEYNQDNPGGEEMTLEEAFDMELDSGENTSELGTHLYIMAKELSDEK